MHQSPLSGALEIIHPTCAKCGAPMWLTRIEPDEPGFERRTFECQACENQVMDAVQCEKAKT
jgi:hypothetical protein